MTTRPELMLKFNTLGETDWKSEDELVEFLQEKASDITDLALLRRAIDYAITGQVLSRTGTLIVRRRMVSESMARGFGSATEDLTTDLSVDTGQLAHLTRLVPIMDMRLRSVEAKVDELEALRSTGVHWLQLHPGQMPRPLYDSLKGRAIIVLGKDASEHAVAAQMTLVAAQIIQLALRPQ